MQFESLCNCKDLALGYQKQVQWLTQNFHGLPWDTSNGYTISYIGRIIAQCCERNAIFYCKGVEKTLWLRKLFRIENLVNVEDEGCSALNDLHFKLSILNCTYHEPVQRHACALRTCMQLQFWMKLQSSKVVDRISTLTL